MTDRIERVPDEETADQPEFWNRLTDDEDVLGVSAGWDGEEWWTVYVSAAEFVREGALEERLDGAVTTALREVSDVVEVQRDDRETWVVSGTGSISGEALVGAVAEVLDELAPALRELLEE